MTSTTMPSPFSAAAARVALGATILSAVALVALHALSPEFAPSWRMVSEYANGRYGWVLTITFLTWAASSFALAAAVQGALSGRGRAVAVLLLVLAGVGEAMGGLFDVNHPLHGVAFAVGIPSLVAASLVVTWAGRRAGLSVPAWSGWLPLASVGLMVVAMAVLFSTLQARGIEIGPDAEPLDELPDGVTAFNGWANRLLFATAYLWAGLTAAAILRRPLGGGPDGIGRATVAR